jgi:PAS domain S-box-containing protein
MDTDHPLRILFVEDVPADAELAARELRNDGIAFTSVRVDTKEAFLQALEEFRPDVILSDYAMPEFDGMTALELSLSHDANLPFIILTGSMNEETAVACMKAGATDYIIKEHMKRIPLAVRAALVQKQSRMEKEDADRELIAIYENAPLMMLLIDGERRVHKVNGYTEKFVGQTVDAILGIRCGEALRCFHALDVPEGCGFGVHCEACAVRRLVNETLETGRSYHNLEASLPYLSAGQENNLTFLLSTAKLSFRKEPLVLITLLDITERKVAEDELKWRNILLSTQQETSLDGILVVSEEAHILSYNRRFLDMWHIPPEVSASPADAPVLHCVQDQVVDPAGFLEKVAYLYAHREEKSLDDIALKDGRIINRYSSSMSGPDGRYYGRVWFFRDITEIKRAQRSIIEQKRFLEILLDTIPSPVFYKDLSGQYLGCNPAFEEYLGRQKEDIIGKTGYEVALREIASKYEEQDRALFAAPGKQMYECKVKKADGSEREVIFTKATFQNSDGQTGGLVGIIMDISDLKQAEAEIKKTLGNLRHAFSTIVQVMVAAVEARDPYTSGHQIRSADLARAIATEMGLPGDQIDGIRMAASIHDIGKLSIPAEILSKPTNLTEIEFALIKEHAQKGFEMIKDVESPWPLAEIVHQHHERMDGSGYPRNLKGDEIIIEARIMAVADVVESMASHRPYRAARGIEPALAEIEQNSGVLYDPDVAAACLRLFREKGFQLAEA